MSLLSRILGPANPDSGSSLAALRASFDERVVAEHLVEQHELGFDIGDWLTSLRQLAEQSYENKALSFGCLIDTRDLTVPDPGREFPKDFLQKKRYKALSDGYRTVYVVSKHGALLDFRGLSRSAATGPRFHPEWCEELASSARDGIVGLALTRQGDIVVFDNGQMRFTYRFGRWQYWNHTHVVDLMRNAARVQNVPPTIVSNVVRALYRSALDVSFRKSGGLFVLLRSQATLHQVVRPGEAVDDINRGTLDAAFDAALDPAKVQLLSRAVLAELAALDGAVVVSNSGQIMSFGSILEPQRKGSIVGTEGSRAKAAIGASNYGLAIKVSSDGEISVFLAGDELIAVG